MKRRFPLPRHLAETLLLAAATFFSMLPTATAQPYCVPRPPGLVAWWRAEGDAADFAGVNQASLQNGATFAPGKVGQAFKFDGVDDYVMIPHNPALNLSVFTLETWIRCEQPADTVGFIWSKNPTYYSYGDPFALGVQNSLAFGRVGNGVDQDPHLFATVPVNDGQWHHLAFSCDGSMLRLFLDGSEQSSAAIAFPILINTQDAVIGQWAYLAGAFPVHNYKGLIDELALYNRALSPAEIQAIYQAASRGKCTGICTDPPVITLSGSSSVSAECHGTYTDGGAIAVDACSGEDLTTQILVTGTVDVNTPGTYTLTYNVSNGNGTPASPVVRTVHVVDTTAPVVTLNGVATVTVECHSTFSDPGATASDACAGALSVSAGGSVNANAVGTYTLTYSASDPSGHSSSIARTVNVVDTTAPVITCPPDLFHTTQPVPPGATTAPEFLAQGGTISDNCDGNPTVTSSDHPTTGDPTTIIRTYTVTDASGNTGVCQQTISTVGLFAADAIIWGQPLARTGMTEDSDPSNGGAVKYRFKRGSTIPIQIRAVGRGGGTVSGYANVIGRVTVFGDTDCDGVADGNSLLIDNNGPGGPGGTMDKIDGLLRYNLDTKQLPPTTRCYVLQITVIDTSTGESRSETVSLQAK